MHRFTGNKQKETSMKGNRKLLKEVLKEIRHDMTNEEVLNLLAVYWATRPGDPGENEYGPAPR